MNQTVNILVFALLTVVSVRESAEVKPPQSEVAAVYPKAEVVVCGDAAVGVAAAVQSARTGKATMLVSQYGHLGGMTSSGLGWTDAGNIFQTPFG